MTLVLSDPLRRAGDVLIQIDQVDSTMAEAVRRFAPGLHRRIWIVAGEQMSGRGRQGRGWTSPPGNLHMTLLLPTATPLRDQPKLGFAAGVALARAVRSLLSAPESAALKWPNDLLIAGAKVSGLLLEGLGQGAAVAIGIGVNIVAHPQDTPYAATHLRAHSPDASLEEVFARLASALVEEIESFADGRGFGLTRQRWLAHAAHLGHRISVRQPEGALEGVFREIDDDGRLVLATTDGLRRIAAGDVFPLDK